MAKVELFEFLYDFYFIPRLKMQIRIMSKVYISEYLFWKILLNRYYTQLIIYPFSYLTFDINLFR